MDWTGTLTAPHHLTTASTPKYHKYAFVPKDSGFVAVLMYLKNLRMFVSEVGLRSVHSLRQVRKVCGRAYHPPEALSLESVTDSKVLHDVFHSAVQICPRLRSLTVEWAGDSEQKDRWLPVVSQCGRLHELVIKDVSFTDARLSAGLLPDVGPRLTRLELLNLEKVKFSHLRLFKERCANLELIAISVKMKINYMMMGAEPQIRVRRCEAPKGTLSQRVVFTGGKRLQPASWPRGQTRPAPPQGSPSDGSVHHGRAEVLARRRRPVDLTHAQDRLDGRDVLQLSAQGEEGPFG